MFRRIYISFCSILFSLPLDSSSFLSPWFNNFIKWCGKRGNVFIFVDVPFCVSLLVSFASVPYFQSQAANSKTSLCPSVVFRLPIGPSCKYVRRNIASVNPTVSLFLYPPVGFPVSTQLLHSYPRLNWSVVQSLSCCFFFLIFFGFFFRFCCGTELILYWHFA